MTAALVLLFSMDAVQLSCGTLRLGHADGSVNNASVYADEQQRAHLVLPDGRDEIIYVPGETADQRLARLREQVRRAELDSIAERVNRMNAKQGHKR